LIAPYFIEMLATYLALLVGAPLAAGQFTLHILDKTKYPLAQCLDGSYGGTSED
jgi:hypothetical protein